MRRTQKSKPLLEVGMNYVKDCSPLISNEKYLKLEEVLDAFIDGKIDYSYAEKYFNILLNSVKPLDKINKILKIKENPIPSPNEKFKGTSGSSTRKKTHQWSEIEDQRLLSAIHHYGLDNWTFVSFYVGNNRTRAQCAQRWFRGLDPHISKLLWSDEEDQKLLESIEVHGNKAWTKISSDIGTRSDAQCRYRYKQLCNRQKFLITSRVTQSANTLTPNILKKEQVNHCNNSPKLPSIDNFVAEMKYLPNHLKFNLLFLDDRHLISIN